MISEFAKQLFIKGKIPHYVLLIALVCYAVMPVIGKADTSAADITISGVVTDGETGESFPGVNVIVKGTTYGTITDANGAYKLTVPENSTLVFSFVGYNKEEILINNQSTVDVMMMPNLETLGEVVVIGYGTQKNANLTSAISKLSVEKIEDRPIGRVDQALIGQMAGVQVQEVSGSPGRALNIKIRGTSTITAGTDPLYVVDGIPITGGLDNISVGNIESIEVLKDAASSAIYGSRGSNGVVLITTKKGKSGEPVVTLNSQIGVQEVSQKYPVLNRDEWIDFAVEERTNTYLLNGGDPNVPMDERSGYFRINPEWISNPESFPDTDWQDLIYRKALIQNHQLSVSGGDDKTKYYIYADFFQQDGVIIHSNYERYSFKANVETKLSNRLKLGLNLMPNFSTKNDPDTETLGGVVSRSLNVAPIVEPTQGTENGGYNPYTASFYLNPVSIAEETENEIKGFRTLASLYGELDIIKNLTLRSSLSIDQSNSKNNYFITNNINRGRGSVGRVSTAETTNILNENTLHYDFTIDQHSVTALAGYTIQEVHTETTYAEGTGFPDDQVKTLNAATNITNASAETSEWALLSYLARVNYNFADKYLLSASIRRDGSSRFGNNNKWGWFPSASVGWRLSDEAFMQSVSLVDNLKLRLSYGITGNNLIPNYGAFGLVSQANYVLGEGLGNKVIGLAPSSFSNADLGWERTSSLDAGVDLGLFESRISLSVDYYRNLTKDLLLEAPVPGITGFQTSLQNIGKVENKGVELELNARILTGNFKWNVGGNIAHNKNTVKELGPDGTPILGSTRGFIIASTQIGHPIGSYYLIPVEGIFKSEEELNNSPVSKVQNVGDYKYSDTNNDGVITDDDRVIVGHNNPDFVWGMSHSFQYKNFDLSILFNGEWGNQLLNINRKEDGQSRGNVPDVWLNRWKSPEDPGDGQTPRAAITANLTTASTAWMYDASFWRIRNITLGYNLPTSLMDKITGFSNVRMYGSIENLFTHDNYFGVPQTGAYDNNPLAPGIDAQNTYPIPRTFTFGVNISFE